MEIEERVLDRWRNVLSMAAAVTATEMADGYSETARYSSATVLDVVTFVSRCHDELVIEQELAEDRPWGDEDGFPWSDEFDQCE